MDKKKPILKPLLITHYGWMAVAFAIAIIVVYFVGFRRFLQRMQDIQQGALEWNI